MAFAGRFTERAQRALMAAQEAAKGMGHDYVGTEHLLLGLLREPGAQMQALLGGITYEAALAQAERLVTILMGDKVDPRRQYISEHANFNREDSFSAFADGREEENRT